MQRGNNMFRNFVASISTHYYISINTVGHKRNKQQ